MPTSALGGGKQNWKRKADPGCLEQIDPALPEGERSRMFNPMNKE